MSESGLQVKRCEIDLRVEFETRTLQVELLNDLTFPVDFGRCSYAEADSLFREREEHEIKRILNLAKRDEERPDPAQSASYDLDQYDVKNWNKFILQTLPSITAPPSLLPTFCLSFAAPPSSAYIYDTILVNGAYAASSIHPHIDPSLIPQCGSIPLVPGQVRSLCEFESDIQPRLGEQWSSTLLVAVPICVLRSQMRAAFEAGVTVGKIAFFLSVSIFFRIINPHPSMSSLFFTTYAVEMPGKRELSEVPLLVTSQASANFNSHLPWFPSVPPYAMATLDAKHKLHARVPWTIKVIVENNMTAIAPGILQSSTLSEVDGKTWKTCVFETTGPLGGLFPAQVAIFAGPFSTHNGASTLFPLRYGQTTTLAPDLDDEDFFDGPEMVETESTAMSVDVLLVSLKGWESKSRVSVSHLSAAMSFIADWTGCSDKRDPMFNQLTLLFLPVVPDWPLMVSTFSDDLSVFGGDHNIRQNSTCISAFESEYTGAETRFWVFDNVVVLSSNLLHSFAENDDRVRLAKLAIVEAVLAVWYGGVFEVPIGRLGEDAWLAVALRKYLLFKCREELMCRVDAVVWLKKTLDLYCACVERGLDRMPLSATRGTLHCSPLADADAAFQLKCCLILPAFECLLVSIAKSRNWVPSNFMKSCVFSYISRVVSRLPRGAISTEKFFDRIALRLKSAFIRASLHRTAAHSGNNAPLPPLPDDMPVTRLDPSLYKGNAQYDIGEVLSDVYNFQQAFVYGTGCGQIVTALFVELQKRTGALETLRARVDQSSLQPPREVSTGEISHFFPGILTARDGLTRVLTETPSDFTLDHGQASELDCLQTIKAQLSQSSTTEMFLENLSFNLASIAYNPLEMIVRDNKTAFGFGYIGSSTAPIAGGKGPLFSSILKHALTTWSHLPPEHRSVMASDTTAMEALVATSGAGRPATSSTGGQPYWMVPMLAWQCFRDILSTTSLLAPIFQQVLASVTDGDLIPDTQLDATIVWAQGVLSQGCSLDLIESEKFSAELPESGGSSKFWPVNTRIRVFEDHRISEDDLVLRSGSSPGVVLLRDAQSAHSSTSAGARLGKTPVNRVLGVPPRHCSIQEGTRFLGSSQSNADGELLQSACSEQVRTLFTAATNQGNSAKPPPTTSLETMQMKDNAGLPPQTQPPGEIRRLIPLLWVRPSEDSFQIARTRRFQSVSMWIQQLLYDPDPIAQLEAVRAVGILGSGSCIHALKKVALKVRLHSSIRNLAVLQLAALSHTGSRSTVKDVTDFLLGDGLMLGKNTTQKGIRTRLNWMPPLYSPSAMSFLKAIVRAISLIRSNGETPPEVWTTLTSMLTSLPSPVDMKADDGRLESGDRELELGTFVGELITCLGNISWPQPPNGLDGVRVPVEAGLESVASHPPSWEVFDYDKWMGSNGKEALDAVWQRCRMEVKFVVGRKSALIALLGLIPKVTAVQIGIRVKQLQDSSVPWDPLRLFLPIIPALPPLLHQNSAETFWTPPPPDINGSSHVHLENFVVAGTSLLETCGDELAIHDQAYVDELSITLSYAAHAMNFVDHTLYIQALRCFFSLVLQGKCRPPDCFNYKTIAEITDCVAVPTAWDDFANQIWLKGLPGRSPLACVWVDHPAAQQMLTRTGLSVLYAVRVASQLRNFLPFADVQDICVGGWHALNQCLWDSCCASAVLPFCLHTPSSFSPVLTDTLPRANVHAANDTKARPHKQKKKKTIIVPPLSRKRGAEPRGDTLSEFSSHDIPSYQEPEDWAEDELVGWMTQDGLPGSHPWVAMKSGNKALSESDDLGSDIMKPASDDQRSTRGGGRAAQGLLQRSHGVVEDTSFTNDNFFTIGMSGVTQTSSAINEIGSRPASGDVHGDSMIAPSNDVLAFENRQGVQAERSQSQQGDSESTSHPVSRNFVTEADYHGAAMSDIADFNNSATAERPFRTHSDDGGLNRDHLMFSCELEAEGEETDESVFLKDPVYREATQGAQQHSPEGESIHTAEATRHRTRTKKKKRKQRRRAPILLPPVVLVFELLYRYLLAQAPTTHGQAFHHVAFVKQVMFFLFGSGWPRPVAYCVQGIQALREHLLGINATTVWQLIENYLQESFKVVISPPPGESLRNACKAIIKTSRAGVALRQIPTYERCYMSVWNLPHSAKHWPLPLDISWRSLAQKMTQCLIEHPAAAWFVHAVDANENPSYYRVIENPMWLNKALTKLKMREYTTFDQWKGDIFAIFRNCRTFNAPHTLIVQDCDALQSLAYQLLHFAERILSPWQALAENEERP